MRYSTKKMLMLLAMSVGLISYNMYAGKKNHQNKHQNKHQNNHQGQESKQSLDSLIAELKIYDEQKRKKEEAAREKELNLENQHLQTYPLTPFLGSSYQEPKELYNKRLIFADGLMKKLGGLVHTYGLLIQNIGNQQKVLKSPAFTITDDEIVFSLSPQSAEGVALLHAAKPIINGIKTILHPKFRLKAFMPSFSFEQSKDYERIFQTCIQQNLNQDIQDIAKKLSIAHRYYCFVAQEKQIIENHAKIAASIESCSMPGSEILEKNIYGLSGSVLSDYLKLHRRPDKIISLEHLKKYAETYSTAVGAIRKYHHDVLQELQSLARELPVPKQQQQRIPAESKQIHKKKKI
jgi:hypothetical protein